MSIDETSLSNGELYTILTNKAAKGKKGTIVAMIAGTKADVVISIIEKIPLKQRNKVTEITLDMAANMGLIAKKCFPNATRVTDRFHVQKLALEALQEIRIKYRWQAIDQENEAIEKAKASKKKYKGSSLNVVGKYKNRDICISKLYRNARFFCRPSQVVTSRNHS